MDAAPETPATRAEVCVACGGLRTAVTYATDKAECGSQEFAGKAHLHRSCTTCGYRTCEALVTQEVVDKVVALKAAQDALAVQFLEAAAALEGPRV